MSGSAMVHEAECGHTSAGMRAPVGLVIRDTYQVQPSQTIFSGTGSEGRISGSGGRMILDISLASLGAIAVLWGGSLLASNCARALTLDRTGSPSALRIARPRDAEAGETPSDLSAQLIPADQLIGPVAGALLQQIREDAALTLEEIAPLVGVTRRSLQHWLAGGPISARKERRLREAADAVRALCTGSADATRQTLFARRSGGLRLYDLLSARQFEEARQLGAQKGRVHSEDSARRISPEISVAARMNVLPDRPAGIEGKVNLQRSRRLKR